MISLGSRWNPPSVLKLSKRVDSPERNSAGRGQRQGGSVHARLDRELPGLAFPRLKKRRHVMHSLTE
eukprot:701372-Amphidinium_carterae.1